MRQHFALWFRLDGRDGHLAWWSDDDADGVLTAADGRLRVFATPDDVRRHAARHGLAFVVETPILHDLDAIAGLGTTPSPAELDGALSAWNLFDDVSGSTDVDPAGFAARSRAERDLYGALFASTPVADLVRAYPAPHALPPPGLAPEEVEGVRDVLRAGLALFRAALGDGGDAGGVVR